MKIRQFAFLAGVAAGVAMFGTTVSAQVSGTQQTQPGIPSAVQQQQLGLGQGGPAAIGTLRNAQAPVPEPRAVQFLRARGNTMYYMGQQNGLHAYLARATNGGLQPFYITPDGNGVIAGLMFNADGQAITMAQVMSLIESNPEVQQAAQQLQVQQQQVQQAARTAPQAQTPQARLARAEVVLNAIPQTNWFRMGAETAPIVYMMHDANCPWCERSMQLLRPALENGQIQLRIVPVGTLSETSLPKAAAILSSPNPAVALAEYEGRSRPAPPPNTISQDAVLLVRQNEQFSRDYDLGGTPQFVFRDGQGIARIVRGMPRNMPDDLLTIVTTGQVPQ